jgi:hypothetical protein
MAKKYTPVDASSILAYPFQDPDWIKKLAVACGLLLIWFIPIIPEVLLLGYLAEIMRRIGRDQQAPSLPEWEDLSGFLQEGIKLFGVGLVYCLPSFLLLFIGYAAMLAPAVMAESVAASESQLLFWLFTGDLVGFMLMGTGITLAIVTCLILPIACIHSVVQGSFQAAFNFKEIWSLFKANWGGFLVAYLIMIGAAIVLFYGAYFLVATIILCCLYPFVLCIFTSYLAVLGAGLFGEAYRGAAAKLPAAEG